MRYFIIPLMGALFLCSCGNNNTTKVENQEISVSGGIITVAENAPVSYKIKKDTVRQTSYQPQFSTSGVVKTIPTSYAEIATPFAGRVIQSFVRLGQTVSKGSPLFELSSPSFFETGKAYFGARQEMEQALKSLNREKDLLANRVGIAKEVEEAEVNYQLKRQDYENARSALKVFQVEPEAVKLGEPLIVRAPIAGKVVTNHIVIGQYIKEDTDPLAVIADLTKVWVVAHVKEKDIRLIERLQEVDIRLSASPEKVIKGQIFHISEMLDEATRSVEVIVECENQDGSMKPFMYGTVQLTDKVTPVFMIATSAILQEEETNYVLLQTGKNKYKKTMITVANAVGDKTVVTSGLSQNDVIISEGAFYLLDAK